MAGDEAQKAARLDLYRGLACREWLEPHKLSYRAPVDGELDFTEGVYFTALPAQASSWSEECSKMGGHTPSSAVLAVDMSYDDYSKMNILLFKPESDRMGGTEWSGSVLEDDKVAKDGYTWICTSKYSLGSIVSDCQSSKGFKSPMIPDIAKDMAFKEFRWSDVDAIEAPLWKAGKTMGSVGENTHQILFTKSSGVLEKNELGEFKKLRVNGPGLGVGTIAELLGPISEGSSIPATLSEDRSRSSRSGPYSHASDTMTERSGASSQATDAMNALLASMGSRVSTSAAEVDAVLSSQGIASAKSAPSCIGSHSALSVSLGPTSSLSLPAAFDSISGGHTIHAGTTSSMHSGLGGSISGSAALMSSLGSVNLAMSQAGVSSIGSFAGRST